MRVATANVKTLMPAQETKSYGKISGAMLFHRMQLLEQQFAANNLQIVGVQEGRARSTQERSGSDFRMLTSAADEHGDFGVQLWVAHALHVVTWSAISPRLLYGVTELRGCQQGWLVGHAPHEFAPEPAKDEFWLLMQKTYDAVLKKYPVPWCVLLDGNARVGSVPASPVGRSSPERQNGNGARLVAFSTVANLFLANTFGSEAESGPTWTSTTGTRARIDYIAVPHSVFYRIASCGVQPQIDLSMTAHADHDVVVLEADFVTDSRKPKVKPKFRVNKQNLQVQWRREFFQNTVWLFQHDESLSVSERLEALNDHVRWAASEAFGRPEDVPRKRWLSPGVWEIIKHVAPLRRARYTFLKKELAGNFHIALLAWRLAAAEGRKRTRFRSPGTPPLLAMGDVIDADTAMRRWRRRKAECDSAIVRLQALARPMLEEDRQKYLDDMVRRSNAALTTGDMRTGYALVRALSGASFKQNPQLLKKDGSVTSSQVEVDLRWQEHFAEVLAGDVVQAAALHRRVPAVEGRQCVDTIMEVGPEATELAFAKLGRNKGVGPDGIPAELLQAGEGATAVQYSAINELVLRDKRWPVQWCGGRMAPVYKKKGDPRVCDNSRGILLADHSGKALTGLVKRAIDPPYEAGVPRAQCGAVPGRGTEEAAHVVRTIIDWAKLRKLCLVVLFIDLVKAFDKVVRQLVMGWGPEPPPDPVAELRKLGVSARAAVWLAEYIEQHGTVFQQWAVDGEASEMARTLHENAWFAVADLPTVVTSRTGGRQGCKLGATIFNSYYSVPLKLLEWRLAKLGVCLVVQVPEGAFWQPLEQEGAHESEVVVHATFVDDECLCLVASTPAALDRAIELLLDTVFSIFDDCHLAINLQPGKTEAFLQYRGDGAVQARERWRCEDGVLRIHSSAWPGRLVNVVDSYKHLGTYVSSIGDTFLNTVHRAKSAMGAYGPIAHKVFGNRFMSLPHKLALLRTLVLSRLLHAVHITTLKARDLTALNAVYMRALRKIAGQSRHSANNEMTDLAVRKLLRQPSVECLVARARLLYLGKLVRRRPRHLLGLLGLRRHECVLPWLSAAAKDVDFVRVRQRAPLPPLLSAPIAWHQLMQREGDWVRLVNSLFFEDSACDKRAAPGAGTVPLSFQCETCGKCFASKVARMSHERAAHGRRSHVRAFARSSVCACCGTQFHNRLRLLDHLGNARTRRCLRWCEQHVRPLSPAQLRRLDDEVRVLRSEACKRGRTHHVVQLPAKRRRS